MSTKSKILNALTHAEGAISGNDLARQLGISRSAIWKAIEQLRQQGYAIEAATNRGYRLMSSPMVFNVPEIQKNLRPGPIGCAFEFYPEIESTNNRARELAVQGAEHGTVVLADQQISGRGRFGRAFFSPKGIGVYMSVILRPQLPADRAVMLTSLSAVAVARAIDRVTGLNASIKWVNDIYLGPKKTCGILCEAGMDFESGQLQYVVAGIGINVGAMEFPENLKEIATSLSNECGRAISRSRIAAEVLNEMNALYPGLADGAFMEESRARSNVLGRDVQIVRGDQRTWAHAVAIDDSGSLVVVTADGQRETLHSGEISVRFA